MKEIILPAVERMGAGEKIVAFLVSPDQWDMLKQLFYYQEQKSKAPSKYYKVRIGIPGRPRSTGWKSQNHHVNGHCQQIAIETGNSFSAVKEHMKFLAINRGYPMETMPDGMPVPKSEADITVEEAAILIETIHQFAAEWNIELKEGDFE